MDHDSASQPKLDRASALDQALARAFAPPPVPEGFQERVMAVVCAETSRALASQRTELEAEYDRRRNQFKRDYAPYWRQAVASGVAIASLAAASSIALVPWLRTIGDGLAPAVSLLAVAISVGIATFDMATSWDSGPCPRP